MGLLSKQKVEREKYINCTDFINLIAFTTNEVIEDIVSYLINNNFEQRVTSYHIDRHMRITQDEHNQHFDFNIDTREFLDDCYLQSFFSDYISYDSMNKIRGGFYYLIDEIQSLDFIKDLKLDTELIPESKKAMDQWYKEQLNPIYRHFKSDFNNPNYYQSKLIKQDSFSVIDAACLLSGTSTDSIENYKNHPKFTELYSDYISYKLMFELALTNNELNYLYGAIPAIELQEHLYSIGYIIKGFNDWLTIEPAKPLVGNKSNEQLEARNNVLIEAQAKIVNLENQLAKAKAELLQVNELMTDVPADEIELNPKTQTAVTRLLNVLFHKAQLDITAHKGTTNKNIVNSSVSLNAKITEKPVSHWIKQVQQLRIDTLDKYN